MRSGSPVPPCTESLVGRPFGRTGLSGRKERRGGGMFAASLGLAAALSAMLTVGLLMVWLAG